MRIAYLSTQSGYYGGEVHLAQLAAGMHERGHEVVCLVRPGSGLQVRLAAAGLCVQPLPLVDWFDPRTIYGVRRRLRATGVEILHTHTPRDYYIAAVATVGTPARNVGTRHLLQPLGAARLKRPFLQRFAAMIAVSQAVRDGLLASQVIAPDRVVTIPNGVDTQRPLPARDGLRRAARLDPHTPVIGFVGRLVPEKGVETLLAAVRRLHAAWPQLRLFVVGDDPGGGVYAARLRRLARDLGLAGIVQFFGYVEDAARACADFDVQVICSAAEPFGLVTLEAMAHRHPVVVTASGGSREIVRDGVDGFLVPPNDPQALALRLEQLLLDPVLRRRLGENGRARVEETFSSRQMLNRTEDLYRCIREHGVLQEG
jgi:glycosyltransferase involved in cell wall biosynthesis